MAVRKITDLAQAAGFNSPPSLHSTNYHAMEAACLTQ